LIHLIPDVLYGQVEGFFALSTDISEIKSQQRELENMNLALTERTAQAEAASRAKSTFLANMSHEIRTPMNAIMGLLQLLDDTVLAPEQRSYLNKIGSAAEVLLNVLNDVLDLSRVEANKLELQCERFTLDDLLTQTMDLFTYRAEEKDIQLFCTKTPDSPASVMGDRLRLAQVLNNLLSNALKFTEVGRIHVELKSLSAEGLLQFSVSDTGPGMSAEQAASLFKPFSQLDSSDTRKHGGAGLGLSICKHLVQLMGGDIWVESTPGQGARFVFTMTCQDPQYQWQEPASSSPPKHSLAKPPASLHTPPPTLDLLQGLRVLVVDDHKLNRLVASEMIRKAGGLVSLAEDGQQAIDACKGSLFDVILMDLQMPTVDGFEASRQIQHLLGDRCPPIVAVTASASEKDRQRILASGMVDHLIKPFHKDRLLAILSGLGHKSPSDA